MGKRAGFDLLIGVGGGEKAQGVQKPKARGPISWWTVAHTAQNFTLNEKRGDFEKKSRPK